MSQQPSSHWQQTLTIGHLKPLRLDVVRRVCYFNGREHKFTFIHCRLVAELVRNDGQPVSRERLIEILHAGRSQRLVSPSVTLRSYIAIINRAFRERLGASENPIRSVPTRGYQIIIP